MRLIRLLLVFMGVVVSNTTAQASGFIRDAEIENLLADYSRPLFLAAGLNPNTVGIALINNKVAECFCRQRTEYLFPHRSHSRIRRPEYGDRRHRA